jgi:hypothetical protein
VFKEFLDKVVDFFQLSLQIGTTVVIIALFYSINRWLSKYCYFFEDYSTGFLKVKERLRAAAGQSMHDLNVAPVEEGYLGYGLEIGKIEDNLFDEMMRIPGSMRSTHMYIVGASGTGKSSLLKNLLIQDMQSGIGLCVIDPHGDLVHDIIPFLGKRKSQTLILDLEDTAHMLAYNPLEQREGVLVSEQVAKLILAFKRIWSDSWGARMEDILRHTLALLIEHGNTLSEFERLLTDADFRNLLIDKSEIDQTKEFFQGRYNTWNAKERALFIESSLNKVSAFLADRRIGARLSQPKSSFSIKEVMDSGGILLVNLGKGRLAGNADLFGSLLMADIEMSFLTRKENERRPFALYVDEFQNIATESFDSVLAEARKFGLCLTMAHQSLKQLDDKLVSLILGNAQTQVYFRVSRQDAERLAKESENIVRHLEARDEKLLQEPENKFSLPEMWEIAFHNLSRLEFRKAYVMIKGVLEYPIMISTLDTPLARSVSFDYSSPYSSLDALEQNRKDRKRTIEAELLSLLETPAQVETETVEAPSDLGFLEGKPQSQPEFVLVNQETIATKSKNFEPLESKPQE